MNIINNNKKEIEHMTFHWFEMHKVYKSTFDGNFYAKITLTLPSKRFKDTVNGYYGIICLNTMEVFRMCDLIAKTDEFIEVDYQFEIKD